MRNTKLKIKNQSGFTLIEIAIGMIIIGLLLIPTIAMYKDFRQNADWTKTERHKDAIITELGGFNASFGRYPCPARTTAVRGANRYGFEVTDCHISPPAAGTCSPGTGLCAYASPNGGKLVVVGTLPFKDLNLLEDEAYDGYNTKFTYAVTLDLTDSATYNVNGGAVGIAKSSDLTQSAITNPNTAHYAVISHGANKAGAYVASTAQIPCSQGSTAEQENCDSDAIFTVGEIANGFDDRVAFFDGSQPTEWKKTDAASRNIYLKDTNSIALGALNSTDISTTDHFAVKNIGSSSGVAKSDSSFLVDMLCEKDVTNVANDCFTPSLLAGDLVLVNPSSIVGDPDYGILKENAGHGISCPVGKYLTGIENKIPKCEDEIFLSCKNNSFISAIETDGSITCDAEPEDRCSALPTNKFCGENITLPDSASGTNILEYSGECRMFQSNVTDTIVITEVLNLVQTALNNNTNSSTGIINYTQAKTDVTPKINDYINVTNAKPRDDRQCSDVVTSPLGLVRDAFRCENGTWSKLSSHRIKDRADPFTSNHNFIRNLTNSGTNWKADNSFTGADPQNNKDNHNCWCREDYRAFFDSGISCNSSTASGYRLRIQKHTCPQTTHRWATIFDDLYLFCGCEAGTETETKSCNKYYDEVNGITPPAPATTGLTGDVITTYATKCDGSGNLVRDTSVAPIIDTSQCACAAKGPRVERDDCPGSNDTNSWISPSPLNTAEIGITEIRLYDWICPGTTSGGLPDPGSYSTTASNTFTGPTCVCNTSPIEVSLPCPSGLAGLGRVYSAPRDCTTGNHVTDKSLWTLIPGKTDCNGCKWTSSQSPSDTSTDFGNPPGSGCACGDPTQQFCSKIKNQNLFDTWSNCECTPIEN